MDNNQPARDLYNSLTSFKKLTELINDGHTESLYLECKSPVGTFGRDLQNKLAEGLSGFSNTEGGVYVYGVATTKHKHSGLDVLTQVEPMPNISDFKRRVENSLPTLTMPHVTKFMTKILKNRNADTAGVLLVYIPRYSSRPIQALFDERFYIRSGDDFVKAPYSIIEQKFASSDSPDLKVDVDQHSYDPSTRTHKVGLLVNNYSLAPAEFTKVFVEVENKKELKKVAGNSNWNDVSGINKGRCAYVENISGLLYYRLGFHVGFLEIEFMPGKRRLELEVSLYAKKMVPKNHKIVIHLLPSGMKIIRNEQFSKI